MYSGRTSGSYRHPARPTDDGEYGAYPVVPPIPREYKANASSQQNSLNDERQNVGQAVEA